MNGLRNIINMNEAAARRAKRRDNQQDTQEREEDNAVLGQVAVTQPYTDGSFGIMNRKLDGTWAYTRTEARTLDEPPILQQIPAWSARDWCEKVGVPSEGIDAWFGEEDGYAE